MNGNLDSVKRLLNDLTEQLKTHTGSEIVVIPPAIYLPVTNDYLTGSVIKHGAQNVYPANAGAFTGELSALMLLDFNCQYVLVGHSERRTIFAENEKFVADKFHHVKEHDMIPVLCVGESLEERQQGLTEQVIARQLRAVAERDFGAFNDCIIAYEPVWAIGTGHSASPEQVQTTHKMIRSIIAEFSIENAQNISLLYGGSVNEKNAAALFAMPDVDGGLIGGASLNARQFVEIIKCIN